MIVGKRLGPYEIVAPIGAGGMGEVYRARDSRINREVAVKVLPGRWSSDPERLRRFEQESRAAGSINHPNLVTIYDVGTDDGSPYIVMELLEGETLRDRIGDGNGSAVPQRKAVDYAIQVAHGLAAAHAKGIVHRDLKPENLFVTRDGRVKILDFGLVKLTAPPDDGADRTQQQTEQRGTSPGTVMGTAGYMSPEQIRGEEVDQRTDIFSFGAILYEMLSGRRAFHGKSAADTMSAILREDPPDLSASAPSLSPALNHIVRHCLEKNREERFQSARDLAFDLQTASGVSSPSGAVAMPAAVRAKPWMLVAIPVVVLALAAIAAYRSGYRLARARTEGTPVSMRVSQLTFRSGVEKHPSISPDGRTFVFVSKAAGNDDIYLQRIDGQNAINLTKDSPADDTQPAFSPDGSLIAFRSERNGGGIFVMGATGESVRQVSDFGFNPAWSPDGKEIVCGTESIAFSPQSRASNSELWIIDIASGRKRLLTNEERGAQPSWSPHGNRIAFWGVHLSGQRDIYTIDARRPGAKPRVLFSDAPMDWNPVWSPDGKYLYFGSDRGGTMSLWRVAIDEASGEMRGEPQQLPLPARFAGHFSISQSGKQIVYSALEMASAVRKAPLTDAVHGGSTILSGSMLIFSFDISPDQKWIAFSNSGLQEDLYVARIDGSDLRQITNDVYRDRAPTWSPDGRQLYFYSNRGGEYAVWRINPDGSGLVRVTEGIAPTLWFPRLSPDGTRMIATGFNDSFIIPVGSGVSRSGELLPSPSGTRSRFIPTTWSPDSQKLAGVLVNVSNRIPEGGVFVYDLATKKFTKIRDSGNRARWLADGRTLVILDTGEVALIDLITRQTRQYPFPPQGLIVSKWADPFWTDGKDACWVEQLNEADIWLLTLNEGS